MIYKLADRADIDLLVTKRLEFIEVKEDNKNFSELKENCYNYFQKALQDDTCDIVLAEENGVCIGTGIIFYYDSVPSSFNMTGKNAYITSMYVQPEFRRRGIAKTILEHLISRATKRGHKIIMLNASDMGKPLYEKLGFVESKGGMLLKVY